MNSMPGFLLLFILSEVLLPNLIYASKVHRQTTKVRISAIGNTITLKFLQLDKVSKLEGYILGYGSSLFSKQLIQLPEDGEPYETEIDAEPKYLVAVQPAEEEVKKQCVGKETLEKPLHLVIGSVTQTTVLLSWGTLLNTLSTESNLDDCIDDGQYTVRYREKEPKKTWNYHMCSNTETVIDDLKPDTPYEFGVRAESEDVSGVWSPPVIHNTAEKDIHTPMMPNNYLQPKNPITESTQTFSPSVPVTQSTRAFILKHPETPPTQRVTQAIDTDNRKPLQTVKPLRPKKPITKSPQTFSPSVPVLHSVTQSKPAALLRLPEHPPTERITKDIHKPLKPEIFLMPEKPITEISQAVFPSESVLFPVLSSPTSGLRQPEPLPTQREMHVLHSVTQSRPASLLRHPGPSPVPRVTLGHGLYIPQTGSDAPETGSGAPETGSGAPETKSGAQYSGDGSLCGGGACAAVTGTGSDGVRTSHPAEDSLSLTQTLTSIHTSLSNFKTTNSLKTYHPTIPSLLITNQQPLHSTQSKTVSSTVKAQLNVTQKKSAQLHNSSAPKFSAIQNHEKAAKYSVRTAQPKTRPPKPYTVNPKPSTNQAQHSTRKSQLTMTQTWVTTLPIPTSTTQSQPHADQPQSFSTQSQPEITHPKVITTQSPSFTIPLQSITTQSQSHIAHPQSIVTQSTLHTTQTHITHSQHIATQSTLHTTQTPITHSQHIATQSTPHTTQTQSITTQYQPHIIQTKATEPQSSPNTTKSQTNTVKYFSSTDNPQPTPTSLPTLSQPLTAQTQSIATQSQPHIKQSQPDRTQPQIKKPKSNTNGRTTKTKQPNINKTKFKPKTPKPRPQQSYTLQPQTISTQTSTATPRDTFRPHQKPVRNQQTNYIMNPKFTPNRESLSTTEFQQQPDYYPTSATIKLSNSKTWQNSQTEHTFKSKSKQPVRPPSEKVNTQNSPWGEKKPVNKKIPVSKMASSGHTAPSQSMDGHQTKPVLASGATNRNQGKDMSSPLASVASPSAPSIAKRVSPVPVPNPIELPPTSSNTSVRNPQVSHDEKHKGQLWNKHQKWIKKKPESNEIKNQLNQVDKVKDKAVNLKVVDALPILKPSPPPTTGIYPKPTPTTTPFFAYNGSRFNIGDNASVFSSIPISDLDPKGKKRFVAPHVVYQIDKPPKQPCSVTHSLNFFPDEDNGVTNITGPPKIPPTNITVVAVEGCPSFVILDWETTDNETTEYEVTSSIKSPNGRVVSVVKTNQTHTAVENLKPESSYEFKVTPKNELGSGPSSESVSFSTESADPRVSEIPTGKNAIWSSFTFDADSYSECTGTQYVKRTWYRKFVGIQLCNSLRYKIYLSDSLKGKFYNIGDETGYGEDHCQFVDSFLDGRTGGLLPNQLPARQGYFRGMRQEPVRFGKIGGNTQINYVSWYECGVPIPGSW